MSPAADQNVYVVQQLLHAQLAKASDNELRQTLVCAQMTIERLTTPDLFIRMPRDETGERDNLVLMRDVPSEHFALYGQDYGKAVPFMTMHNHGTQWAVARPTIFNHKTERWDMIVQWFRDEALAGRAAKEARVAMGNHQIALDGRK